MHVKIEGFKIHIDVEFIFNNNEMILLKGGSGAGKSTILQAIYWCLYGNMRSIYNNTRITKNLSVTLSLPGIKVSRKKNPELLTVELNGNFYEDLVAQNIIDERYGNRELWKACSYIEQKSRCAILSGSGSERLELLNALSFTGDSPKQYITKISEKLKEATTVFEKSQACFLTELEIYNQGIKERPVKHLLKSEEIENIKLDISILQKQVEQQNEKVLEQERLLGKYNYLISNLENLKNKFKELENITLKEFSPSQELMLNFENDIIIPEYLYNLTPKPTLVEKQIISFSEYSENKNILNKELTKIYDIVAKKERLEKEISELKDYIEQSEEIVTKEDIWQAEKSKLEREKYLKECKNIGLEYNQVKINETLKKLSEQLSVYTKLESQVNNYNRLLEIRDKIKKYEKGDIKELERLSTEKSLLISDLKKGLELLSCPKCQTPIRYLNGTLQLGERSPVSKTEIDKIDLEYKEILKKINNLRTLQNLEENEESLSKDINEEEIKQFINSGNKITSLSNFISKISNIKYIEDVDVDRLKKLYNYQEWKSKSIELENLKVGSDTNIKEKLQVLEEKYSLEQKRIKENQELTKEYQLLENSRLKELDKYEKDKKSVIDRNKKKKDEMENWKKDEDERKRLHNIKNEKIKEEKIRLEKEILEVENEKSSLEIDKTCKDKFIELKNRYEEKKYILEEALYALKVVEKGKELQEKRNKLICLQKDVQTLNKLKIKAMEIECKQLEETVNSINTVLETTINLFFNEPISLVLLLYKKVKNNLKPGLIFEICYKGCKYDNINCLSGGEGDRISLALLLALNFVSNSPIIMLDECVSSLDGDLKESCITAIKSIPNKTVICIDHDDGIEGFYDSVIEVF